MAYWLNPVKGDIERLDSLFGSLSEIYRKQKIDDELRKKSVESGILLKALAKMVGDSVKRYNVDVEEMRDEGGALDDVEKQHKRSVL